LTPALRRRCGVGNATGLGMAPFLIAHPELLDRWMYLRESALALVLAQPGMAKSDAEQFCELLARGVRHIETWRTDDAQYAQRLTETAAELRNLATIMRGDDATNQLRRSWLALHLHCESTVSLETREFVSSLMVELHGS